MYRFKVSRTLLEDSNVNVIFVGPKDFKLYNADIYMMRLFVVFSIDRSKSCPESQTHDLVRRACSMEIQAPFGHLPVASIRLDVVFDNN